MILQTAIEHYGVEHQLDKVDEELRELILALEIWRTNPDKIDELIDEIADVKIMVEQLEIMLSDHYRIAIDVLVNEREQFKINRLKQRIEDDKNRHGV